MRPASLAPAALAALCCLSAAGCAPARMRVDPAVASATEAWAVTGANPRRWNAPVAFGPYRSGPVHDAGTIGWSFELLGVGGIAKSRRPYAWTLDGPGGAIEAECHERAFEAWAAAAGGVRVDAQGAAGAPALACAFRPGAGAGGAAWTLSVRAAGGVAGGWVGELRGGGAEAYAVRSTHALEGSPLPLGTPAGWRFERAGAAVALVEVVNAGRVWLPRGDAAPPLAAASVALLLFQAPAAD